MAEPYWRVRLAGGWLVRLAGGWLGWLAGGWLAGGWLGWRVRLARGRLATAVPSPPLSLRSSATWTA